MVYLQACNIFKFCHLAPENELRQSKDKSTADVIQFPARIADHVSICVGVWSLNFISHRAQARLDQPKKLIYTVTVLSNGRSASPIDSDCRLLFVQICQLGL